MCVEAAILMTLTTRLSMASLSDQSLFGLSADSMIVGSAVVLGLQSYIILSLIQMYRLIKAKKLTVDTIRPKGYLSNLVVAYYFGCFNEVVGYIS